jgi:Tfp pilus assembly protein PilX
MGGNMGSNRKHKGIALLMSMIFLAILSAWAASIYSISGVNLQVAYNHHNANNAFACAESGLEIMRYWLNTASIPGTTSVSQRYDSLVDSLENNLTARSITNIGLTRNGSTVTISPVDLNMAKGESFYATITALDTETMQINVTGTVGSFNRTIRVNYQFGQRAHTVFDYGIATKGPLRLTGHADLDGVNLSVESNVYIESADSILALSLTGNSQIAGDVAIANPLATVHLQGGHAGIGGETGQDAIDNHVTIGDPPTEFPTPVPTYFEQYIVNDVNSSTDTSLDATFENIRIVAGTNPSFSGNVTLNGIVFIETPNIVTFSGGATITGIIVGDGDINNDNPTNQISFLGTVSSYPVSNLPDEPQFTDVRNETGTFLMAPGFAASFGGNFTELSGAIAANGIDFFGNAGGIINGSIINYSNTETILSGDTDLQFNHSGTVRIPAGFVPEIILRYQPTSYSEVVL